MILLFGDLISKLIVDIMSVIYLHGRLNIFKLLFRPELFLLWVQEGFFGSVKGIILIISQVHTVVQISLVATLVKQMSELARVSSVVNVKVSRRSD